MAKSILTAIKAEFLDKTDVVLPEYIAKRVDDKLKNDEWLAYYHEDATTLDTADRDIVFDMISIELGFDEGWPMYGSSCEYQAQFACSLDMLAKANEINEKSHALSFEERLALLKKELEQTTPDELLKELMSYEAKGPLA